MSNATKMITLSRVKNLLKPVTISLNISLYKRMIKLFGVKHTEPQSGSFGGPERPSILHRPSGDADKCFIYSLSRISDKK